LTFSSDYSLRLRIAGSVPNRRYLGAADEGKWVEPRNSAIVVLAERAGQCVALQGIRRRLRNAAAEHLERLVVVGAENHHRAGGRAVIVPVIEAQAPPPPCVLTSSVSAEPFAVPCHPLPARLVGQLAANAAEFVALISSDAAASVLRN
jgi:hypothetical protein